MYFSGRNISWSLEPIYPSCQVIDLGDYFNLSVNTPLQILFYIKRVPNLSVSLYFEDKGRVVASRILKSNILSYAGPKFRNNDLSNPIDMKVLLKLSQNIDSERDQKKRCKNYPNREYVSYLECDRKYFQELILNNAKPPLTPFWITSNHSEVTKLENCHWNRSEKYCRISPLHNYVDIFDGTIDSGCSNPCTTFQVDSKLISSLMSWLIIIVNWNSVFTGQCWKWDNLWYNYRPKNWSYKKFLSTAIHIYFLLRARGLYGTLAWHWNNPDLSVTIRIPLVFLQILSVIHSLRYLIKQSTQFG